MNSVIEKYIPKGSKRALLIASFDGEDETETDVLCGIVGNNSGIIQALKATIRDPMVLPFYNVAVGELEQEDIIRDLVGPANDCNCPDCVSLREHLKGKIDPRVN